LDERDVTVVWRNLFHGKEITPEALAMAETLLDGLSGESTLLLRLANELEDLKKLNQSPKPRTKK
jgi:hypothetical protein